MVKFASRMNLLKGSAIRELLALANKPEVLSFAGGMPAPELFPVDKIKAATDAVMEEQARDLGFHFIFIEHDLEDCRTVSRQDMRNCVNSYMSVVLGEEPLDPTIVEFDDSAAY